MAIVYLCLGSNMGDRFNLVQNAVNLFSLAENCDIIRTSALYETEPWGYKDQNWFLNLIVEMKTTLSLICFTQNGAAAAARLLDAGFADSFRLLHPDEVKYSWWSYRFRARARNAGWRIDYFLVSKRVADKVRAAEIHNEVLGSDHCPVELDIDLDA